MQLTRFVLAALATLLILLQLAFTVTSALPLAIPPPNKTQNCQYGVNLEWSARVGSSVFATPVIVDLMHDGRKEILIPTFSQYLEGLAGATGDDLPGYPFVHPKFKSYSSPLPVDIDGDGRVDWLVATYTGELLLFNEEGTARTLLQIPPLAVKKNWSKLHGEDEAAAPLDKLAAMRVTQPKLNAKALADVMSAHHMHDLTFTMGHQYENRSAQQARYRQHGNGDPHNYRGLSEAPESSVPPSHPRRVAEPQAVDDPVAREGEAIIDPFWEEFDEESVDDEGLVDYDGDYGDDDHEWAGAFAAGHHEQYAAPKALDAGGHLSKEAKASLSLLFNPDMYRAEIIYDDEKDAFSTHHLRGRLESTVEADEVAVDAHILSTPRIVDIDGNGLLDIILHVSYFFDPKEYASPQFNKAPLPEDVNPDDYAATAVVCVDLITGQLKWVHLLHLTSKTAENPAFGLSSPLVVNADRKDASLEIYVTSSTGSVVGLSNNGAVLPGWPVWIGPIAASPTAEDLVGNDTLNICVGDVEGKIRCLSPSGQTVWERTVVGGIADQITYGDVNGDGQMDVVFGTSAGLIYALNGRTGERLPNFPIVTGGSVVAPVLLVNLRRRRFMVDRSSTSRPPLTLVVPSHDGKVYLVDGFDGCIETVDIDEKSSSMVLTDDITGNGQMDLLVTTINGGVYVFETLSPYHPLKAWSSKTKGLNGNTAGESQVGVHIVGDYRRARDIRGDRFKLKIQIDDSRAHTKTQKYHVSIYVGTRTKVFSRDYTKPGEYMLDLRAPMQRMYSSVNVVMTLPNGQVFTDSVSLSFNIHFLSTIKYVLAVPFLATMGALMLVKKRHEVVFSD